MPRDAISRTANFERNGGHKWVNKEEKKEVPEEKELSLCAHSEKQILVFNEIEGNMIVLTVFLLIGIQMKFPV